MARTIFDFTKLSDTALDTSGDNVFNKLTDNPAYPNPDPDLATVDTHLQEYRSALVDAALGDRRLVEVKNVKRKQLEQTLRQLAAYVEFVAKGDVSLILGAGFDVAGQGTSVSAGPRPKPTDVNVIPGMHGSGVVEVRVKRDPLARLYRYEYRPLSSMDWTMVLSSRSRLKLQGLQEAQRYEFRVAYLGTDPSVNYSDVVTGYVG